MNVMAKAHKNTKLFFKVQPLSSFTYAQVFRDYLKQSHKEFKAMQTVNTVALKDVQAKCMSDFEALGFTVKGTAIDSEGRTANVGLTSSRADHAQREANYWMNPANGFTRVELTLVLEYTDTNKTLKIVK